MSRLEAGRRPLGNFQAEGPRGQSITLDPGVEGLDGLIISAAGFGQSSHRHRLSQGELHFVISQGRIELILGNIEAVAGGVFHDDFGRQDAVDIALGLLRQAQVVKVVDPLHGDGLLDPAFPGVVCRQGQGPVLKHLVQLVQYVRAASVAAPNSRRSSTSLSNLS